MSVMWGEGGIKIQLPLTVRRLVVLALDLLFNLVDETHDCCGCWCEK